MLGTHSNYCVQNIALSAESANLFSQKYFLFRSKYLNSFPLFGQILYSKSKISKYCMASSVSGQNASNPAL